VLKPTVKALPPGVLDELFELLPEPVFDPLPDCEEVLLPFVEFEPELLWLLLLLLLVPLLVPGPPFVLDEQATTHPRAVTERIVRDKEIGLLIMESPFRE
jgi:hypothetical protein